MCISACHLMGLLKYDKSSLFHSIRLYVSYLYLQIKHDKTPNSTTTRQLDWLTTVQARDRARDHNISQWAGQRITISHKGLGLGITEDHNISERSSRSSPAYKIN